MEFAGSPFEIKSLSESGHIEGLLAGFGNTDSHGDVVDSKAFTRTLAERNGRPLPMLLHHDLRRPIGAWKTWEETKSARLDQRSGTNHLLDIELMEGSLVTVPSNPKTLVAAVKSITGARDIAELLQASGLSGRQAKAAAGAAWKSINSQDDEAEADAELVRILNASAKRIASLGVIK